MKKITLLKSLMLAVILLLGSVNVSAQLLVEDFNYTAASLLTDNGWTAHSSGGSNAIDVTTGLTFTGYAGSGIGGAANVDNTGEDVNRNFTAQTSGLLYTAFMVKIDANTSAGYFFNMGANPMGTTYFSRIWANSSSNGIGIGAGTASPTSYVSITTGNTVMVVLKHDFTANTTAMFVLNSFSSTEPASSDMSVSETVASIATVALRQYNAAQRIIVDGIRVGTTWAEAVAPATSSCTASNLAFANATIDKVNGDAAFTQTASSLNETTAITYSSGTPAVATVNATSGEVTIIGAGSSIITATQLAGTHNSVDYCASTASYTVNVASSAPTITVTEVAIPAMTAVLGNTDSKTITVSGVNLTDNITLTISGTNANQFSVLPASVSQSGGIAASTLVTITYTPTAVGTHTALLTLTSAGATPVTRDLSGTAFDPSNPYGLSIANPVSELNETFEGVAVGITMPTGWTNVSVQGAKTWEIKTYNTNQYAQMSAYGGTGVQQTMLISPAIDFDHIIKNNVSFGWIAGYAKPGTTLKVYVMTLDGTKSLVKTVDAQTPTSGYDATFNPEVLDLTAFSGVAFLVFEYNGDASTLTTTYEMDNVIVLKDTSTLVDKTLLNLNVYSVNGTIRFNADAEQIVEVYNAVGQKLFQKPTVDGLNIVTVTARGILFVKVGDRFGKVIL